MTNTKGRSFWIRETSSGEIEYRTSSKVLLTILPLLLGALVYKLLIVIEGLEMGPEIIIVLAYGVVVLMVALILLVVMISIIEYLRRFE